MTFLFDKNVSFSSFGVERTKQISVEKLCCSGVFEPHVNIDDWNNNITFH